MRFPLPSPSPGSDGDGARCARCARRARPPIPGLLWTCATEADQSMFSPSGMECTNMNQGAQKPGRRNLPRHGRGPAGRLLDEALELHQAGRLDLAERAYRRFLARHRNHAFALQNLGLLLHQRGDFEGARAALRRAIGQAPDAATCRESLGRVLKAQGDLKGALAAFREALEREPRVRGGALPARQRPSRSRRSGCGGTVLPAGRGGRP